MTAESRLLRFLRPLNSLLKLVFVSPKDVFLFESFSVMLEAPQVCWDVGTSYLWEVQLFFRASRPEQRNRPISAAVGMFRPASSDNQWLKKASSVLYFYKLSKHLYVVVGALQTDLVFHLFLSLSLAYSHSARVLPIWQTFYSRPAFSAFVGRA